MTMSMAKKLLVALTARMTATAEMSRNSMLKIFRIILKSKGTFSLFMSILWQ
jgi:hypothetical protein